MNHRSTHHHNQSRRQPKATELNKFVIMSRSIAINSVLVMRQLSVNAVIKGLAVMFLFLSFFYGYLINQTVTITAEYSQVESRIVDASSRLSHASAAVAAAEALLQEPEVKTELRLQQVEPAGFVSRANNSGLTMVPSANF